MTPPNRINLPTLCLRLGAFLCFAGWTWIHYYWEGPYGVLLWHDATFEFASRLGLTWEEFVGDGINDGFVQQWIAKLWWLYLACTLLTLTVRQRSWLQMIGLVLGSGLLVVLSYAAYVASQNQLPMFIEHGGQMLSPILLVMALALGARHRVTVITAIVAVILTFAGHGSYALGLWPTPGNFYAMTTLILGVEYPTAQTMLRIAGVLDFVVCIGICIPYLRRPAALYASIWGFLTAIARPVAGMSWGLNYWGADQYLHEAVLRAPHCLIPLYLFLLWRQPPSTDNLDKLEPTDSEPMGNE
ncbi:hypothetical protein [Rosistilla oblonga]|uniref:hypothetical protein n=1 Tax=Rosistilla oblonga TaxID=2527990 RepID=UPI003A96DAEC